METGLYFEGGPHHGQTTEAGGDLELFAEVHVPTPRCLVEVCSNPCGISNPIELLTYYATDQFHAGRQVLVFYLNNPRLVSFEI